MMMLRRHKPTNTPCRLQHHPPQASRQARCLCQYSRREGKSTSQRIEDQNIQIRQYRYFAYKAGSPAPVCRLRITPPGRRGENLLFLIAPTSASDTTAHHAALGSAKPDIEPIWHKFDRIRPSAKHAESISRLDTCIYTDIIFHSSLSQHQLKHITNIRTSSMIVPETLVADCSDLASPSIVKGIIH